MAFFSPPPIVDEAPPIDKDPTRVDQLDGVDSSSLDIPQVTVGAPPIRLPREQLASKQDEGEQVGEQTSFGGGGLSLSKQKRVEEGVVRLIATDKFNIEQKIISAPADAGQAVDIVSGVIGSLPIPGSGAVSTAIDVVAGVFSKPKKTAIYKLFNKQLMIIFQQLNPEEKFKSVERSGEGIEFFQPNAEYDLTTVGAIVEKLKSAWLSVDSREFVQKAISSIELSRTSGVRQRELMRFKTMTPLSGASQTERPEISNGKKAAAGIGLAAVILSLFS